jgi:Flp pilus assembly protein TadD
MKPADRLNILERGLTLHRAARFADALPLSCEMLAADACLSLRDFTAAAGYLGKLAAGDLRDAQYRFNLGVALENSGRVDAAATAYENAMEADAGDAAAIANLAGALAKMRAFNLALAIYDSAIQR